MVVLVASVCVVMVVVKVMCIWMCGNGGGRWRVSIFRSFLPCPPGKQAHPLDVNRRWKSGVLVSELFYFNSIKRKRSGSSSPFFKSNPGGRLKGGGCHQLRSTPSPQMDNRSLRHLLTRLPKWWVSSHNGLGHLSLSLSLSLSLHLSSRSCLINNGYSHLPSHGTQLTQPTLWAAPSV